MRRVRLPNQALFRRAIAPRLSATTPFQRAFHANLALRAVEDSSTPVSEVAKKLRTAANTKVSGPKKFKPEADPGDPQDTVYLWQRLVRYTTWVAVAGVGFYTIFEGPPTFEDGSRHCYTDARLWWAQFKRENDHIFNPDDEEPKQLKEGEKMVESGPYAPNSGFENMKKYDAKYAAGGFPKRPGQQPPQEI